MILTFSFLDMSSYRDVNFDPVLQRDLFFFLNKGNLPARITFSFCNPFSILADLSITLIPD